ncbi:MAG: type IV pilus modification protein PilV [Xanthomonadales bacterium]|nr:type IV pilus modification protein PilV [Xanthomonadales bacterium]
MIEVLVALFVTSIGLLGLAALQMTSLRYSHNTHARSQATFVAMNEIETMRANKAGARAGDLDKSDVAEPSLPSGKVSAKVDAGIATVTVIWGEQEGNQTFTYRARL